MREFLFCFVSASVLFYGQNFFFLFYTYIFLVFLHERFLTCTLPSLFYMQPFLFIFTCTFSFVCFTYMLSFSILSVRNCSCNKCNYLFSLLLFCIYLFLFFFFLHCTTLRLYRIHHPDYSVRKLIANFKTFQRLT